MTAATGDGPRFTDGAGGTRLAYDVQGDGPVLILMHGGGQDRSLWADQARALADEFTVVTPDIRGHGQSDKPEQPEDYAADRYVEDVDRLADAVQARHFSLWGFSLGATMALQVAATSSRVQHAVIAGSHFGRIFTEEMLRRSVTRLLELIDMERQGTLDPAALPENERVAVARGHLAATRAWLLAAPGWPPVTPAELRCPTFVYAGAEDPVAKTLESQRADIAEAGVRLEIFSGLDHFQEVSRIDVVLPVVRAFLKEPQGSAPSRSPHSPPA